MKKFFYKNSFLISTQLLLLTAIFIYKTLLNPILIHDYLFLETVLNIGNIFFSLGWIIGILFLNELFKFKFNFFRTLKSIMMIQIFLLILEFLIIYFNKEFNTQYLYIPLRGIEGFINQMAIFLMSNLLTFKMITNKQNGSLNGIVSSLIYLIKFSMPLIGAILIIPSFPLFIMIIPFSIFIYLFFIIKIKEKIFLIDYHKFMLRKINNSKRKFSKFSFDFFKSSLNIKRMLVSFTENMSKNKWYFFLICFFNGRIRIVYDFYFVLFLIHSGFSLKESVLMMSFMLLGLSAQFVSGFISERISFIKLYEISLFFFIVLFIIVMNYKIDYLTMLIISFIFGFLRTFGYTWDHNFISENYKNFKITIEEGKTLQKLFVESGTITAYITGIFIYSIFSFYGIFVDALISLIILIITSFSGLKK